MDMNSLAHTKWECKYHIVFAPKFRRKVIYKKNKGRYFKNTDRIMQKKIEEYIRNQLQEDLEYD